jgi:hypothetical protein
MLYNFIIEFRTSMCSKMKIILNKFYNNNTINNNNGKVKVNLSL